MQLLVVVTFIISLSCDYVINR